MIKKELVKRGFIFVNLVMVLLLIVSLINYQYFDKEINELIKFGGLSAMIFLVFILEGAPVLIGGSVAVASMMALEVFSPWFLLAMFLVSAFFGNLFYYFLGVFAGRKVLSYFDKKDIKKYEEFFKQYGHLSLLIMAVTPIPYLPTLAGVFKNAKPFYLIGIMIIRLIRHSVVFFVWYYILF